MIRGDNALFITSVRAGFRDRRGGKHASNVVIYHSLRALLQAGDEQESAACSVRRRSAQAAAHAMANPGAYDLTRRTEEPCRAQRRCGLLCRVKTLPALLVLLMCLRSSADTTNRAVFARAGFICDELLKTPDSADALETFRASAAGIEAGDEIRTRLAAVYALGLLAAGQDTRADAVITALLKTPADSDAAARLGPEKFTAPCPACNGSKSMPCAACRGSPACSRCGGKGWIPGSVIGGINTRPACPSCRGTGACTSCMGKGKLSCTACGGIGRVRSAAIARENYLSAITVVRAYMQDREFPEAGLLRTEMDRARRSMDIDEAIATVSTALSRWPEAPNAAEAKRLLAGLKRDREEARSNQAVKEALIRNAGRASDDSENAPAQASAVVNELLRVLSRGGDGAAFMAPSCRATASFTPVSWRVGEAAVIGAVARVPARVEADGVGPDAVRNLVFTLEFRGDWTVTRIDSR